MQNKDDKRVWKITSKRDGHNFYAFLMNDEIIDLRTKDKCTTGSEVMKSAKQCAFMRKNGERKPTKINNGFYYIP